MSTTLSLLSLSDSSRLYDSSYGTILNSDCLDVLENIYSSLPVKLTLTDLPYGCTSCHWDSIIPSSFIWSSISKNSIKNAPVAFFGVEPFSTMLRASNLSNYKYDWIWEKNNFGNPSIAKSQPLRIYENISIFYSDVYYPQGLIEVNKITRQGAQPSGVSRGGERQKIASSYKQKYTNYPRNILRFKRDYKGFHPTQKPVALLEYLIRTYTKEGDLVLDFTAGSCSVAIACMNTKRKFLCVEKDENFYKKSVERVINHSKNIENSLDIQS